MLPIHQIASGPAHRGFNAVQCLHWSTQRQWIATHIQHLQLGQREDEVIGAMGQLSRRHPDIPCLNRLKGSFKDTRPRRGHILLGMVDQ